MADNTIPAALRDALDAPYSISGSTLKIPPSSWERMARGRAMQTIITMIRTEIWNDHNIDTVEDVLFTLRQLQASVDREINSFQINVPEQEIDVQYSSEVENDVQQLLEKQMNIKVGDWVRFYKDGRLYIGVVEYIRDTILGYKEFQTDIGTVREDYVLEVRHESIFKGNDL